MSINQIQTLLELANHILLRHPELAPNIELLSKRIQGKGFETTLSAEVEIAFGLFKSNPKLVVDIGGNIGDYTVEIRKKSVDSEIHVFEPSRLNIEILKKRFADDCLINVLHCALSDFSGGGTLWSDTPGSGAGSLVKRRLDYLGRTFDCSEEVVIIKFEEYWSTALEKRGIDFVKIDIEGYELAALKGFGEAIQHTIGVQFEFGGTQIDTRTFFQDFWYFFKDAGFTIFRICPEPQRLFPIRAYSEALETFEYQNYVGINNRFMHLLSVP